MGRSDVPVSSSTVDTTDNRANFSVNEPREPGGLLMKYTFLLEHLGITYDLYEPEIGFNSDERYRYIRIHLNTDITIQFKSDAINRSVTLNKNDAGFEVLHANLTSDRQRYLSIYSIEAKPF